jgi:hypothetical protein
MIVGAVALPFFLRMRSRTRSPFAQVFNALVIGYALLLLPWTAIEWSRLGRPLEALAVPQIGMLTMALTVSPGFWPGILLVTAFAAETLFVSASAQHVGLAAKMPTTEPYFSLMVATVSVYILFLRRRRSRLVADQIKLQGEATALDRIAPLFAKVRDEISVCVGALSAGLLRLDEPELRPWSARLKRALERVGELGHRIDSLVDPANDPALADNAAMAREEQHFIAADAHANASIFAAIAATLSVFFISVAVEANFPRELITLMVMIAFGTLIYLLATRGRLPLKRQSAAFVISLSATLLAVATYSEWLLGRWTIAVGRPYTPFIAHKLLLVTLPVVGAALGWIASAALLATTCDALILYFVLRLDRHPEVISFAEPWTTMAFALMGFLLLSLREQRRVASLAVLRAESHRAAAQRRAELLLAVRDQLNSPLQILVMYAPQLAHRCAADSAAYLAHIERLIAVSHWLGSVGTGMPRNPKATSFDAVAALRRH